jgi:two-component system, OmpR family, KDP operon response regulator KdpE
MTRSMHLALVVDSDPRMRNCLRVLLEADGYRVVTAATCGVGLRETESHRPDVVLVNSKLAGLDGRTFVQCVRQWSAVPIVMLSDWMSETECLEAFEAGADDYVVKPFRTRELMARIRAVCRRHLRGSNPGATLSLGEVNVNLERRVAHRPDGSAVSLTPLEHRVLECLARHPERVVSHRELLTEVWGPHQDDMRSLRFFIRCLRRKLERDPGDPQYILTKPSLGYLLGPQCAAGAVR